MPTEIIPFANLQESGLDALSGASPSAMNVVTDARGAVRKRPGLRTIDDAPGSALDGDSVVGLYATLDGAIYAVTGSSLVQKVYRVTGGSAADISAGSGAFLLGGRRPTFAETEALLVIASGAAMKKLLLSAPTALSDLGGSPPEASHVIAQNLRLLANDLVADRTKVWFSAPAISSDYTGHEQWPASVALGTGYFTAEARPDPVVALGENTNEVFVWGTTTLQVMAPDPTLIYAPVSNKEVGCGAPYSVIKEGESFAWLDERRRFVRSDGQSIEVVGGEGVRGDIEGADISGCFGYRVSRKLIDALVWTFPEDGRTFVFQKGVGWGQWQSRLAGAWGQFPVTAYHQRSSDARCLVGTADGKVGELSFDAATDFGETISAHVTTGFLDRGTSARKSCDEVTFTLRRGEAASGEPRALVSYRNDLGAWNPPMQLSLGRSGDSQTTVTFYSLGEYRTRQWRFEFDSDAPLVLVKAEEKFTVLEG